MKKIYFILNLLLFVTLFNSSTYAATGDGCSSAETVNVPSTTTVSLEHYWQWRWWSGRYYYYAFTAPSDGEVHIYTTDANINTNAYLYNSDCSSTLASDTSNANNIDITYSITSGDTYKLDLYNYNSSNYGNFTLHIDFTPDPVKANDDSYSTQPDTQLVVSAADGVLSNDSGYNITITGADLTGLQGTIDSYDTHTGAFTFTPTTGFTGTTSFTYTITDSAGDTSTAIVTITVEVDTDYQAGIQDFKLINPDYTRNIIGNYIITGNTIECITNHTRDWDGTCQDGDQYNDNNYIARYLDVDDNPSTWNSSSANFTLPNSYDPKGGNGILWAGLFWQGSINNYNNRTQRRLSSQGDNFDYGESIDLTQTDGNKVLLSIDGDAYTPIQAQTFYYDTTFNQYGGYYAAYADVTYKLQNANLDQGVHQAMIANLTTNDGLQPNIGDIAGWALVIIYKEDILVGKPRNISIYNGFTTIRNNARTVKISGFRLPKTGDVNAKFSVFAGEGEYVYGGPDGHYDRMIMSQFSNFDPFDTMPGATDPDNIFDAHLANISRDSDKDNDVINTNGIDIDVYDVSSIIKKYRDANQNIDTIYIGLSSNEDYVTPSMMAFSTELYQPSVCYDYTLEVDGYVIPSSNNEIKTNIGAFTDSPMVTRISLQSREGDFNLADFNMTYSIVDTNDTQYIPGTTEIAKNNQYAYIDASAQTVNETSKGFTIYLGEGATGTHGGVIKPYQKRFVKFKNHLDSKVDTQFKLLVQYRVDYGSGLVPIARLLSTSDICRDSGGYYIDSDIFNITSDDANDETGQPYNLYTQVVNRNFNVKVFSHDPAHINDDHRLKKADTAVEIEVYDAEWFPRDVNLSCVSPDSNITNPIFINFNNTEMVPLNNYSINKAVKNAAFKIWYLAKAGGSLVSHHCTSRNDQSCFRTLYNDEFKSDETAERNCTAACNAASGCYACLRHYFGQPVCSKDNFSVRPEAFVVDLQDNGQTTDSTQNSIHVALSRQPNTMNLPYEVNLSADYNYRFDINATSHTSDNAVKGYYQTFDNKTPYHYSSMILSNKAAIISSNKCNDTDDKNVSFTLFHGTNVNTYTHVNEIGKVDQVGIYEFKMRDSNWTVVDWYAPAMTHHSAPGFSRDTDCQIDQTIVPSSGKPGCGISNAHNNIYTTPPTAYKELNVTFNPYDFNTILNISPTGTPSAVVYMNTLDNTQDYPFGYKNTVDENMSFNITGQIIATGWHAPGATGRSLSNFVKECFAQDVVLQTRHYYRSDIPITPENPNFTYDIIDYNTTDHGIIYRPQNQVKYTLTNYRKDTLNDLNITQGKQYFAKDMKGSIDMDLGFNFDRQFNTPINPRYIYFKDLNITLASKPRLTVDKNSNYEIATLYKLDQNITFAYARANPEQFFYDNITDPSVVTPVSVEIYCDLGLGGCSSRGLNLLDAQTSEAAWWRAVNHNNVGSNDGNIRLKVGNITEGSGSPTVNPTDISIITGGADNTVTVTGNATTKPMTVEIDLDTNVAVPGYTDRWLIYNPYFDPTVPGSQPEPIPFYKVRFINNAGGWTGYGDGTGHVVGDDINTKKSRRLEW